MLQVNWIAILAASTLSVILGMLWYKKRPFTKVTIDLPKNIDNLNHAGYSYKRLLLLSAMSLVYTTVLAKFMIMTEITGPIDGLKLGFVVGFCFSSMSLGIIIQRYGILSTDYLKDSIYLVVTSCLMGLILGLGGF